MEQIVWLIRKGLRFAMPVGGRELKPPEAFPERTAIGIG
jgi:hypothetical protein